MEILAGQSIAGRLIEKNLRDNRPFHAYLFEGPEGTGKLDTAVYFASRLNGMSFSSEHNLSEEIKRVKDGRDPDIRIISADGASIKIEQMRDMIKDVQSRPYKGEWKVFIIREAEKMSLAAANSVLKIMEEPASRSIIIMTTAFPSQILATIRSRCQIIPFRPLSVQTIEEKLISNFAIDFERAHLIAGLAEGLPAKAFELAENPALIESRNEVFELIEQLNKRSKKDIVTMVRGLEKDKSIEEKIRLWSTIIRDVLVWKMTKKKDLLYHHDRVEYYSAIENIDTYHALDFITKTEEAVRMLERNLNSGLVAHFVFSEVDKVFKKEEPDG